jgi:hypothetical protein
VRGTKILAAVDLAIPALGLVVSAALFGAGLHAMAQGCLAGAALASADWLLLRVIFGRLVRGGETLTPKKIVLTLALGIKFVLLAVCVYLVVNKLNFDPYGVALGVGSLPVGIVAASLLRAGGE